MSAEGEQNERMDWWLGFIRILRRFSWQGVAIMLCPASWSASWYCFSKALKKQFDVITGVNQNRHLQWSASREAESLLKQRDIRCPTPEAGTDVWGGFLNHIIEKIENKDYSEVYTAMSDNDFFSTAPSIHPSPVSAPGPSKGISKGISNLTSAKDGVQHQF